jgi:hypothetical protein
MIFSTATCCIIISDLPKACFLNGMKLLTPGSLFLIIADSALGVVWRLNHLTSKYEIALKSPLMQPPGTILLGINRIHVFDSFVYFTNSFQSSSRVFRYIFTGLMLVLQREIMRLWQVTGLVMTIPLIKREMRISRRIRVVAHHEATSTIHSQVLQPYLYNAK